MSRAPPPRRASVAASRHARLHLYGQPERLPELQLDPVRRPLLLLHPLLPRRDARVRRAAPRDAPRRSVSSEWRWRPLVAGTSARRRHCRHATTDGRTLTDVAGDGSRRGRFPASGASWRRECAPTSRSSTSRMPPLITLTDVAGDRRCARAGTHAQQCCSANIDAGPYSLARLNSVEVR